MHKAEFIALDTETSGLDSQKDHLLEVAAVRFSGGEVVDTFESLVRFSGPLPLRVERLTGLKAEDVRQAPPVSEVLPKLFSFVGGAQVIGHNISFDLAFLERQTAHMGQPPLRWKSEDTMLLSSLLLPALPSYRLASIAEALEIPPEARHRALGDAITAGKIWVRLLVMVNTLPPPVRALLGVLLNAHPTGKVFQRPGEDALRMLPLQDLFSMAMQSRPWPGPQGTGGRIGLQAGLEEIWGPEGALAKSLEDIEDRPDQARMATAVFHTLERGGLLAAEAGTGIGKSFAYLFPAAVFAAANNRRVFVSTHTRGLQDQLFQKDWPAVAKVLKTDLSVSVVKGKGNYLCVEKLKQALERAVQERALPLALLSAFAFQSQDGDLETFLPWAQLNVKGMKELIQECALEEHHPCRRSCRERPHCFLALRDEKLNKCKLLIVNHALLFSLAMGERQGENILDGAVLIMDEAHHLEDVATQALGGELSLSALQHFARHLDPTQSYSFPQRLPPAMTAQAEGRARFADLLSAHTALGEAVRKLQNAIFKMPQQDIPVFQAVKSIWWDLPEKKREDIQEQALGVLEALNAAHRATGVWRAVMEGRIAQGDATAPEETLVTVATQIQQQCEGSMQFLRDWLEMTQQDGFLPWIECAQSAQGPSWRLVRSPISVADVLPPVFARSHALVFTSATLSLSGGFGFFLERTGLTALEDREPSVMQLPSPFDFENNLRIFVPSAAHGRGGYGASHELEKQVAHQVLVLARRLGGGMMVLFNSIRELKNVSKLVRPELEKDKVLLLAQYIDGSRQALSQEFRDEPGSILFGTRSFFEGIDFKGDTLRTLVMTKLPFPYLKEPVIEGRMRALEAMGRDAQSSYYQPLAIFLLRQAVGRVIRSHTDRGVVFLLDDRVLTKRYGKDFLTNIPLCPVSGGSFEETVEKAAEFLARVPV